MPQYDTEFDLREFLPYLLNQAAAATSVEFREIYKNRYGMLRTEWRVLFHLGRYGSMTAKSLCDLAALHKTKVSRAVAALERKRFLVREVLEHDRRHEQLKLTPAGRAAFNDLNTEARAFDAQIAARFTPKETKVLRDCLIALAKLPDDDAALDG